MICNIQSQLRSSPENCNSVEITGFCSYLVIILELSVAQRNLVSLEERPLRAPLTVEAFEFLIFIADLNRNSMRYFPSDMKET